MLRTHLFSAFVLFLFGATAMFAQTDGEYCGTPGYISESLKEWRASSPEVELRSNDTLYVKMKIHIVGSSQGEGFYPINSLLGSFCKLNKDMAQTRIQLAMNPEINYISNSSYNNHDRLTGRQMMSFHNVNGMVNCYIVANPNNNCGYYSPQGDAVALSKSCLGTNSTTWAHELGHYFSLPHTFFGWEGTDYEYGEQAPLTVGENNVEVEKADGSNCETAADRFCDTPADYLSFRWQCRGGTSPDSLMDPDSVLFLVEGKYIMSYSNDGCQRIFTDEQISAMHFNIEQHRSNEILFEPLPGMVHFDRDNFTPWQGINGEELQYDDVTLSWPPMDNATQYLLYIDEKSPFPGAPDHILLSQDTFLQLDFLKMDQAYEWEIRGFNERYSCTGFSDEYEFVATDLTSSINPEVDADLQVYPNPSSNDESILLVYDAPAISSGEINIYTLSGQNIYQSKVNWHQGQNTYELKSLNLQSGIYILKYRDERGIASRKLVIQ